MGIDKPVVAIITKSFSSLLIIVTTMPGFSVNFLIQKESVWGELISNIAKKIEKNIYWSRIVVHDVSIGPFATDKGLDMLKNEIEIFNP